MKDPAFLFYAGDYLRDTQTLSEKAQVAYDRIMCEHMRNICITQQQLKFFTKKLNDDELSELMYVLKEVDGGFQIEWVAESITKRRSYSESRRKNRSSKNKKHMNNICKTYDEHMINISKTYDEHMENENENENKDIDVIKNTIPPFNEFKEYALLKTPDVNLENLKLKYDAWVENGWKDGNDKKIKNWKTKLLNTLKYLKDEKTGRTNGKGTEFNRGAKQTVIGLITGESKLDPQ